MANDEVHAACEAARKELEQTAGLSVPSALTAVGICLSKTLEACVAGVQPQNGGTTPVEAHTSVSHKSGSRS